MRLSRRFVPTAAALVLVLGAVALAAPDPSAVPEAASGPHARSAATRTPPAASLGTPVSVTRTTAATRRVSRPVVRSVVSPRSELALPAPMHGRAALRALGDRLPGVARLNQRSAAQLTQLLVADPTMWLDETGRLFVKEALPVDPAPAPLASASATYPLAQTFALHSLPGSHRTLLLDFDGVDVGALAWNDEGLAQGHYSGWDPMSDGAAASDRERAAIQEVWARVAEDFAPFDVDVTTQDPGAAALIRSGPSDLDYGTQLVVTGDGAAWQSLCQQSCGGVAWVGTFDTQEPGGDHQLAWVFADGVGNEARTVAEAAAHEIGHTFDLTHDGTRAAGDGSYDAGHGPWAPIMGVSYDHGVTQWSKGDYADANNQQDDVAVIAARAPRRADEAGDSRATAARVPSGPAFVTSRGDLDYYALGSCSGAVSVAARAAATGPDLDVVLTILDDSGRQVATAAPATSEQVGPTPYPWADGYVVNSPVVTGMDAAVTTTLPAGRYYAVVDGGGAQAGGAGDPVTAYDDYGSLGAYTLSASGCTLSTSTVPGAPTALTATISRDGLSATWAPPTGDGGSTLLGFDVALDGGAPVRVAAGATSSSWTDVRTGSHSVSVTAVNQIGSGPSATSTVRRSLPAAPVLYGTRVATDPDSSDPSVQYFYTDWLPPTDDGGSQVLSFRVEYEIRPGVWQLVRTVTADTSGTYFFISYGVGISLAPGHPPANIRVIAVNDVGDSAPLNVQGQIPGAPRLLGAADMTLSSDVLARTLRVDWRDPYDGGRPILGTRVSLLTPDDPDDPSSYTRSDVHDVSADTHTVVFQGVAAGDRLIGIEPYNELGGDEQQVYYAMPALLPPSWISQFAPVVVTYDRSTHLGSAAVSWTAPSTDPQLPILGYEVTVDGAAPVRTSTSAYTLRDLALGSTHSVQVAAVNAAGAGQAYGPPDVRVVAAPAPVTALRASLDRSDPDRLTVDATWTASLDNGGEQGDPEYLWRLQPVGGGEAAWQTAYGTGLQARWLTAGAYTLQVKAHNGNGDSALTSVAVTVQLPDVPGAISDLRVQRLDAGAGTGTATWTAPDDRGTPVWTYWVTVTDVTTGEVRARVPAGDPSYALTGLVRGHDYRVEVTSENRMGEGAGAASVFTLADAPGQVSSLRTAVDRLARTVTATWSAPAQTGGARIQHYDVRRDGGAWLRLGGDATSYTFTDVTAGDHAVEVRAVNGALDPSGQPVTGTPTASAASMLPAPVTPGAVGGLTLAPDAAHGRVTLTWSRPADDGGAAVTDYVVVVGSRMLTTTSTSLTVSGLGLGTTYAVGVAARNAIGTGAPSTRSLVLTTRPSAPRIGAPRAGARGGATTAVFTWSPPSVSGGSPARGYEVDVLTFSGGRQVASRAYAGTASARSLEVRLVKRTGLTYAAVVRVRNAVGWSPQSARSKTVTPG